jgi:hypothetical protein
MFKLRISELFTQEIVYRVLKTENYMSYIPFSGNINIVQNHPEKLGNYAELMDRIGFVNFLLALT